MAWPAGVFGSPYVPSGKFRFRSIPFAFSRIRYVRSYPSGFINGMIHRSSSSTMFVTRGSVP